jgi:hypothetical protein
MNWLTGTASASGVETPLGLLEVQGAAPGQPLRIGIRPEVIGLSLTPASGKNVFKGKCSAVSFLGDHRLYRIEIGGTSILVKHSGNLSRDSLGKELFVHFPDNSLMVFPADAPAAQSMSPAPVGETSTAPMIREAAVGAQARKIRRSAYEFKSWIYRRRPDRHADGGQCAEEVSAHGL